MQWRVNPAADTFWKAHEYTNLNNRLSDEENRLQTLFPFFWSRVEKTWIETNLHQKLLPTHEHDKAGQAADTPKKEMCGLQTEWR